jgi:hypothetical protein
MSRSYKKPYLTDQQGRSTKKDKRLAARRVRARDGEGVANGSAYRKVSNSWDIRDWSFPSKDPKAKRK